MTFGKSSYIKIITTLKKIQVYNFQKQNKNETKEKYKSTKEQIKQKLQT